MSKFVGIKPEETISKVISKLFGMEIAMLESWIFQLFAIIIAIAIICRNQRKGFERSLEKRNPIILHNRSDDPNKVENTPVIKDIFSKSYKNETIQLDNKRFYQCVFDNVTFRWDGGVYIMKDCKLIGEKKFETHNSTFVDLTDLYKLLGFLSEEFSKSWKYFDISHKK